MSSSSSVDAKVMAETELVYTYKRTINIEYWNEQLKKVKRRLTYYDYRLFRSVKNEKLNNMALQRIQKKALENGLYIPCLTGLVGDCMFESIQHTGFCEDKDVLRSSISSLLLLFGDHKVLSNQDLTLKELFSMRNEIDYVFCHKTSLLYKYNYHTMCIDMNLPGSWSRLPTDLILAVISSFFKVRIHIYHDNGYVSKTCDSDVDKMISLDDPKGNIYLGLIGEHHYVPLVRRKNLPEELPCPQYIKYQHAFHQWARKRAIALGLYKIQKKRTLSSPSSSLPSPSPSQSQS